MWALNMSTFSFSYVSRNLHYFVVFPRNESKNRHRQQLDRHLHSKTIKNITVRFVGVEENIGSP